MDRPLNLNLFLADNNRKFYLALSKKFGGFGVIKSGQYDINTDFDTLLVTSIDKFLKKNRISPLSLSKIVVKGASNKTSTSRKIAEVVASAIKISNGI